MPEPGRTTDEEARARTRTTRHALTVILCYAAFYVAFFSPALFSSRLLAPGDGTVQSLPNFYRAKTGWDVMIWGGVPAVADPQAMRWYPPALLFRDLLRDWNALLVSAYVLASCFAYGYAYALTRSRLASAVAGLTYGMSGFMVLHLCHVNIVHAAAWLPLTVWSLEALRERFSAAWFAVGCASVACGVLAGQPQVAVYSLCLCAAAALVNGWHAPAGRLRYYGVAALVVALGLGLSAIQLAPTVELIGESVRARFTFAEFSAYSLPPRQLTTLLFPALYGGSPASFYGLPYFGAWPSGIDDRWGPSELGGYAGLLPLMLAAAGAYAHRRERVARFWIVAGVVALLLATGPATPLGRLVYHLPPLNKFRSAGRHVMEATLAVSVLAAYGVSALTRRSISPRLIKLVVIAGGVIMLACAAGFVIFSGRYEAQARARGVGRLSLLPWTNPATGLPLVVFAAAALALVCWRGRPDSAARRALLVCVLVFDLGSYGWFCEWRYTSPTAAILSPPPAAAAVKPTLDATRQRVLPVRGGLGTPDEFPPNLSALWGLPSASGYGPLMIGRVNRMLDEVTHGAVADSWRDPSNRAADLFAVRYLALPRQVSPADAGRPWSDDDLGVTLGEGCGANAHTLTLDLPTPVRASRLAIVSTLACSAQVADGAEVLRVMLTDDADQKSELRLAAGRDSSEWAYDCPDVRPQMRHARAQVFDSYPVNREGVACEGHDYLSALPLSASRPVKQIAFERSGLAGSVALKKISLIDEEAGRGYAVGAALPALSDAARWRHAADTDTSSVYESMRAMPRAWLAPEALTVTADEALGAIKTSKLPGGRDFDPARTALVEEPAQLPPQMATAPGAVEVVGLSPDKMELRTDAAQDSLLVTSDVYYPGWRATVDGAPAHIYRADYALRGVVVPAGSHVVRLEFRSRTFPYGAAVSAVSLAALAAFTLLYGRRSKTTVRAASVQR